MEGRARAAVEPGRVDGAPQDAVLDDPLAQVRSLVRTDTSEGEELGADADDDAPGFVRPLDGDGRRKALDDVVEGADANELGRQGPATIPGSPVYSGAMALADIPVVYVVGAPRSGTTWVQLMLGSHPEVATPIELDLFSGFVAPWYESWNGHRQALDRPARPEWGLPAALTEEAFVDAVGLVVERTYRSVLDAKPGATVMVEKDPRYYNHVDTILRTVPHAKFVQVLRDGRDVACSMMRVARSWGQEWAPDHAGAAASLWQDAVIGARGAARAPAGYLEVRYEELLAERGADLLRETLAFCGVDPAPAGALYDRYRYAGRSKDDVLSGGLTWAGEAARRGADVSFPDDFIGPAAAGGWREQLGPAERQSFDAVAGELLVELGYEPDRCWAGGRVRALSPIATRR